MTNYYLNSTTGSKIGDLDTYSDLIAGAVFDHSSQDDICIDGDCFSTATPLSAEELAELNACLAASGIAVVPQA